MVIKMSFIDLLKGDIPKKHIDTCKYLIKGIIVILIFHYSSLLSIPLVKLFKFDVSGYNDTLNVIANCFISCILMIVFYFIYRKDLKREWKIFKENFLDCINTGFYAWFVGLIIMFISNFLLSFIFHFPGAKNESLVQDMIKSLPVLMVMNAAVFAPFVEEVVFRKTVKDVFKNVYLFMLVSFLLFGGAHVISQANSLVDLLYIIPYGSLGAAFAYAYYKTDTIFTSMMLHSFHNFVLVIMSILIYAL